MKTNTVFHPEHYDELTDELALIDEVQAKINGVLHHTHRRWEYALGLSLVHRYECKTVLDVGSGGSPFPAILASAGYDVTAVDPAQEIGMQTGYANTLGVSIPFSQQDFITGWLKDGVALDAITAISVLEHVEDDTAFLLKMCDLKPNLIYLTVDFHPSGKAFVHPHHLRTYNTDRLKELAASAKELGYKLIGVPDWEYTKPYVYEYTFASFVLRAE
jgi:2-polyprenyl-3-methyl-5-hydroxy-6-metoxy-1,4-benzoquinol methylase